HSWEIWRWIMTVRTLSLSDLLTDMRIQVECSHVATMPIPLYLRIKETITDMGERHTESKDGEAERNECDCLRRHDSEGMPVGLNPTSPASSDQRGYSVIDSEAMDKLSMDAAETAISHLFFPDDSTRRQQLYQMAHTLRHAFLTLQDKGYLRSPEPVSVDTEIGAEEIWRVT